MIGFGDGVGVVFEVCGVSMYTELRDTPGNLPHPWLVGCSPPVPARLTPAPHIPAQPGTA